MKKLNLRKTVLGVAIVCSSLTVANAQWSVQDVNSNAMKGTLEDILDGVKTQITNQDAAQSSMEVMSKQQSVQMEEMDRRNRGNAAMADTIRRDRDAMPTLQQCFDSSRGGGASAGGSAARGGGGGGGGAGGKSNAATEKDVKESIVSDTTRTAAIVAGLKNASACGITKMEMASKFCTGASSSGSAISKYPSANISPRSLLGNFKDSPDRVFKNYTLNAEARLAADQYLITSVTNYMPPQIKEDKVKYNESYVASYLRVSNGLTTARDTMNIVSSFYNEIVPSTGNDGAKSAWNAQSMKTYWDSLAPVYVKMGMERPEIPSLTELYMAEVNQDYYFLKTPIDKDLSEMESLQEMNRKISLSNFLTSRQIQLQEYQTILLAQLLTQSFLPEAERLTTTAGSINTK